MPLCKSLNYFLSSSTSSCVLVDIIDLHRTCLHNNLLTRSLVETTAYCSSINVLRLRHCVHHRSLWIVLLRVIFPADSTITDLCVSYGFPRVIDLCGWWRIFSFSSYILLCPFWSISFQLLPSVSLLSRRRSTLIQVTTSSSSVQKFVENSSFLVDQVGKSIWMKIRARLRFILDVLSENKEFVLGPAITLVPQLFSLPLFISSFILDCQNLEDSWLRHFLIVSYWISFTPQWTSFFLYVVPSSLYSNEWRQTKPGRLMKTLLTRHGSTPKTRTTFTVLSTTRDQIIDKHWLHSLVYFEAEVVLSKKRLIPSCFTDRMSVSNAML